jgi:hypothetical protein
MPPKSPALRPGMTVYAPGLAGESAVLVQVSRDQRAAALIVLAAPQFGEDSPVLGPSDVR